MLYMVFYKQHTIGMIWYVSNSTKKRSGKCN